MATPSITNTFVASSVISSTDMNQNFSDVINGLKAGSTWDIVVLSVTTTGNLTIAGNAAITGTLDADGATTLNGAVTLGDATGDDITITGRIAADIDPKTASTYALGSSTLPFQQLNIDNGATDGGAIYFDAGTTEFIKASADGVTLDIAGFSRLDVTDVIKANSVAEYAPATAVQGDTPLTTELCWCTPGGVNDAVTLPTLINGMVITVQAIGNTLAVFPASGENFNGAAANASISIANGTRYQIVAVGDEWYWESFK